MKTLTTLTAVAALIAGMAIASAQNAPSNPPTASPNDINKSNLPGAKSGNESQATAKMKDKNAAKNIKPDDKNNTSGASPSSK